jgi:hypothetical protein
VSRLLWRCRGCCQGVKAADEVFEAAVEVSSRCRGVEAAVEVLRLLWRCEGCCGGVEAAVEVSRPLSKC